jgi:hypothetical protein
MPCMNWIPSGPLSEEEKEGRYGSKLGGYENVQSKFDIKLCEAPKAEPAMCCAATICLCPGAIYMRYKALNHLQPDSGLDNYICCQGQFGSICCITPGEIGEEKFPAGYLCAEAFCCPAMAVMANRCVLYNSARSARGYLEDTVLFIVCFLSGDLVTHILVVLSSC